MTPSALLEALVLALAEQGVSRLLPVIIQKLPSGLVETIVADFLKSDMAKQWIGKLESAAADEVTKLAGKAFASLHDFIEAHVHGALKAAVEELAKAPDIQLHLTAEDVKLLAAAFAAGKWQQVVADVERDVGLTP